MPALPRTPDDGPVPVATSFRVGTGTIGSGDGVARIVGVDLELTEGGPVAFALLPQHLPVLVDALLDQLERVR